MTVYNITLTAGTYAQWLIQGVGSPYNTSSGKVMFSLECVCSQRVGIHPLVLCLEVNTHQTHPPPQTYPPLWDIHLTPGHSHPQGTHPWKYSPPVLTSTGGHKSGWCTSWWNTFLLWLYFYTAKGMAPWPHSLDQPLSIRTSCKRDIIHSHVSVSR